MLRPTSWNLDYDHPLAQGLLFFSNPVIGGVRKIEDGSLYSHDVVSLNNAAIQYLAPINRNAFYFPARTDFFSNPKVPISSEPCTISAWIEADTSWSVKSTSYAFGFGHTTYSQSMGIFLIHIWNGTEWILRAGARKLNTSSIPSYDRIVGTDVPDYVVDHISCVFHSSSKRDLYVNGTLVASDTSTVSGWPARGIYLGYDGSYNGSVGHLADPMIHGRALSPAEIAILANPRDVMLHGLIRKEEPVLYFDMGAGTEVIGPAGIVAEANFELSGQKTAAGPAGIATEAGVELSGQKVVAGPAGIAAEAGVELSGQKAAQALSEFLSSLEVGVGHIKGSVGQLAVDEVAIIGVSGGTFIVAIGPASFSAQAELEAAGSKQTAGELAASMAADLDASGFKGATGSIAIDAVIDLIARKGLDYLPNPRITLPSRVAFNVRKRVGLLNVVQKKTTIQAKFQSKTALALYCRKKVSIGVNVDVE